MISGYYNDWSKAGLGSWLRTRNGTTINSSTVPPTIITPNGDLMKYKRYQKWPLSV
jgi:hypothetical protein